VASNPADCADLRRNVYMVDSSSITASAWTAMADRIGVPVDKEGRPTLIIGALPVMLDAVWGLVERSEPPSFAEVLGALGCRVADGEHARPSTSI
jgi:beta-phosphoglucomutase-like phosphatase (HAD superfamily)